MLSGRIFFKLVKVTHTQFILTYSILNMTSKLDRKWWFFVPVIVLASISTSYFMSAAGLVYPYNFAQWMLYALCFVGLQRGISFAGWLLFVCLLPPKTR